MITNFPPGRVLNIGCAVWPLTMFESPMSKPVVIPVGKTEEWQCGAGKGSVGRGILRCE